MVHYYNAEWCIFACRFCVFCMHMKPLLHEACPGRPRWPFCKLLQGGKGISSVTESPYFARIRRSSSVRGTACGPLRSSVRMLANVGGRVARRFFMYASHHQGLIACTPSRMPALAGARGPLRGYPHPHPHPHPAAHPHPHPHPDQSDCDW